MDFLPGIRAYKVEHLNGGDSVLVTTKPGEPDLLFSPQFQRRVAGGGYCTYDNLPDGNGMLKGSRENIRIAIEELNAEGFKQDA